MQLDDTGRCTSVIPKLQTKWSIMKYLYKSPIVCRSSLPASARTSGKDHLQARDHLALAVRHLLGRVVSW